MPSHHYKEKCTITACIFHIVLLICSICLVAIGCTILSDESKGIPRFTMVSIGAFAIAIGVLIGIMILFGACVELPIYIFFLVMIFILQVVLGSLALAATSKSDGEVYTAVKKVFDDYVHNPQNEHKKTVVDIVQQDFKCCGVEGPQYWNSSGFKQYPVSCYDQNSFDNDLYEEGCVSSFEESITPKFQAIGGIAIAFALVQGFGIVYYCILVNSNSQELQRLLIA